MLNFQPTMSQDGWSIKTFSEVLPNVTKSFVTALTTSSETKVSVQNEILEPCKQTGDQKRSFLNNLVKSKTDVAGSVGTTFIVFDSITKIINLLTSRQDFHIKLDNAFTAHDSLHHRSPIKLRISKMKLPIS